MPNLDTLDTLIAVVTVLLILSLIVQSIQEAIKKLLKLKSKQIEESLKDLFEKVFSKDSKENEEKEKFLQRSRSQIMQKIAPSSNPASGTAQDVFEMVMKEFGELGRFRKIVSNFPFFSNRKEMLNSISKEDLMKVLGRIGPDKLIGDFTNQLTKAFDEVKELTLALKTVADLLDGQAGINFAKLREASAPLLNDLQAFFKEGNSDGPLLSDVLALRNVQFGDLLNLLGAAQKSVDDELAATPASDDARKKKLDEAKQGLGKITSHLTNLNQQLDDTLAPLRVKLAEVEKWYDTVMQSFEERYNRGMQATALFISVVVAVTLNANIFSIYGDVSQDPGKRQAILKVSDAFLTNQDGKLKEQITIADAAEKEIKIAEADAEKEMKKEGLGDAEKEAIKKKLDGEKEAIKKKLGDARNEIQKILTETKKEIDQSVALYEGFGFKSHKAEWEALGKKGWTTWGRPLYMGLGWLLMAILLSVGAPFWNDALQSLFGIKNLLRKKSDTKNTEQESGAGQQRS